MEQNIDYDKLSPEEVDKMYTDLMTSSNRENLFEIPAKQDAIVENKTNTEVSTALPPEVNNTIKFNARGKEIEVDLAKDMDKVKQYLSKGYDYNEIINENKEVVDKYKEIDKYASENPEWWNYVQESFINKGGFKDTFSKPLPESIPQELVERLKTYETTLSSLLEDKEKLRKNEEDKLLEEEINTVKKKFESFNFMEKDSTGKTLEQQILIHAQRRSIGSFEVAAKDYLFDKVLLKTREDTKELVSKELKKQYKEGLLEKAPQQVDIKDVSNRSYEDLLKEALSELNI